MSGSGAVAADPVVPVRIAIVAGEPSGDILGASLISAIRKRFPDADIFGIAGPQMSAAGCRVVYAMERLSVMGLVEVLGQYLPLYRLRKQFMRDLLVAPPDLFIGIDAPDFNLGLERRLKEAGIAVVHYVSPSVWAWRRGRIRKIARSVDRLMTLFPFEADAFDGQPVDVRYVGHPTADRLPEAPLRGEALSCLRDELGLSADQPVLAILPGSRRSELERLAEPFLRTAQWCLQAQPDLQFIVPLVNPQTSALFRETLQRVAPDLPLVCIEGHSTDVMAAADVVLLASGTAALEAMLLKKPMVVAYRSAWLTYWLMRKLLRVSCVALPNLLAGRIVVPEYIQWEVIPPVLGMQIMHWLDDKQAVERLQRQFLDIHRSLAGDAGQRAATAALELLPAMANPQ